MQNIVPPCKYHAIFVNLLCLILVSSPILALPVPQATASTAQDPNADKLRTSSGEAVLRTQTPPLNYLPSLDEIKQKANDPELKKLPKAKEQSPRATRCRPGDKACQNYWKQQGKPSSNISQHTSQPDAWLPATLQNLLAWNAYTSPLDAFRAVSDVPFGLRPATPKAAAAAPMMFQGGVTYGGWQTEMTQGRNRMGSTDLFSGNSHWSVPILGLPGRAGHDLGLSLSYNSHVWVKTTSGVMRMIDFDEIVGNPGGGFMLGLPFLRYSLHTTRNAQNAYLLVLPSGKAIELIRRGGTSSSEIYESIDGSVLRLVVEGIANQYLFFPNGLRLRFQNFRCTEIRDRNGNQITATYDSTYGLLTKLTDTLGREITVHYYDNQPQPKDFFEAGYQGYFEITDLRQVRKDENGNPVTVTLAHFGYSDITINTNFASSSNVPNGTIIPMLTSALLADGSLYKFDYTSYGQVKKISHYAPQVANPSTNSLCAPNVTLGCDYRLLSYTTWNLPSTNDPNNNAVQSDCPRYTSRFDWAFEWNAGVTTTFANASDNSWGQVTTADGTIQREYFNLAASNAESWKEGLPFKMETYASGQTPGSSTPKKTTLTTWANNATWGPRVANTTVTDGENNSSRYTLIEYNQNYNLPTDMWTYKGTGTGNMLSYAYTAYLLNTTYIKTSGWGNTQRWIIGLPSASQTYQPNNAAGSSYTTLSKVTYQYDQSGYLEHQLPGAGTIINHDTTNFGLAFLAGRANLTSTTRWDATDENNASKSITSYTKYNTTGAPTTQYLPNNNLTGRTTIISYLDAFSDATANNTLAYPTTITDPDNHQSKLQYRFDIGAVTRTQDPKMIAADPTKGIISKYDALGRLTRVDNQFSNGYTLYSYDTAFYWTMSFIKADDIGNELYTTTTFDGHGRRRASVTAHPNSAGGHRSQYNVYDTMGRLVQWSNPTEINAYWVPAGDDAAGYVWSQQTYDWKGRPKVTTNPDNSTKSYDYGGCGCTGEAMVTVTDEVGRKTRTISDAFLDHTMQVNKTEVLAMDGVTVYATTANVTKPAERKSYVLEVVGATTDYSACANGNCNSATRRQTTTTYNGLGQVLQRQLPQQSGATPYTAYEYYADGSLKKSTDARGAYAILNYNARGMTTSINYTVPGGVETTPNVSFSYDSNGNRLTMTDGVGSVNYSYNTLNRLLSETRTFTGLAGSFALSYEYYNATGQLKKITDPFGDSISYEYDLAGRTRNITGSAFAGVTSYVTNINYRAWGGTKSLTSDNGTTTATMGYNSLMRINNFQMGSINVNYSYYADGRLNQTTNPNNAKLNQYFNWYDPFGRMSYNSALSDSNAQQFYQNLSYDALGHQTYRWGRYWWMPEYVNGNSNTFQNSYQFTNNKITSGWEQSGVNQPVQNVTTTYDNEGNTLTSYAGTTPGPTRMYDATSRITRDAGTGAQENFYNGDGALVKDYYVAQHNPTFIDGHKYHLRSSLLGGEIVTTLDYAGVKKETFVYGNGQLVATQVTGIAPDPLYSIPPEVKFHHRDPHDTVDFSVANDLKWVDAMGVPGKAADSAYITQYQNSSNYPDPATIANLASLFYYGSTSKPQSGLVCTVDGVVSDCDDVAGGKWGEIKKLTVHPGRTGPLSVSELGFLGSWRRVQSNNGVRIPGGENVSVSGADDVWWDWMGGSDFGQWTKGKENDDSGKERQKKEDRPKCKLINRLINELYYDFRNAYDKSFIDPKTGKKGGVDATHEEGRWVFADGKGGFFVVPVKPGSSTEGRGPVYAEKAGLSVYFGEHDLNKIYDSFADNSPYIVATFHTHPLPEGTKVNVPGQENMIIVPGEASIGDKKSVARLGVPGIIAYNNNGDMVIKGHDEIGWCP